MNIKEESEVDKEKPLDKIQQPFMTQKYQSQLIMEGMYSNAVIVTYKKITSNDYRHPCRQSVCLTYSNSSSNLQNPHKCQMCMAIHL